MKTISKILIAIAFVVGVTEANAQKKKVNPKKIIKHLDKDKDGKISVKEAKKAKKISEKFAKIDLNKDGFLDLKELEAINNKKK